MSALPSPPAPPLVVDRVTRNYGDLVALDDVSLTVNAGEMVGFLGPNGAGKSTLISLVTGIRTPTSGTVRLFGGDPRKEESRLRLGTTPQETGLPALLKVGEVIDFVAAHFPNPMAKGPLLERFGLSEVERRPCAKLSGGQRRRLAVALAMLGQPELLVLDEPTTGLDVDARQVLWQALRDYHALGGTVILTSHYLEEVQALAERVVVVGSGKVLTDDSLDAVLGRVTAHKIAFRVPVDQVTDLESREALYAKISRLQGISFVDINADGSVNVLSRDSDASLRDLVYDQVDFTGLTVAGATLEEAFTTLTAKDKTGLISKPGTTRTDNSEWEGLS